MNIDKGYVSYLRNAERQQRAARNFTCPHCQSVVPTDIVHFRAHVKADIDKHSSLGGADADIEEAFKKFTLQSASQSSHPTLLHSRLRNTANAQLLDLANRPSRKRPVSGALNSPDETSSHFTRLDPASDEADNNHRGSKKLRSPPASDVQQRGSSPPTPSRSGTKPSDDAASFSKAPPGSRNKTGRTLWDQDELVPSKTHQRSSFSTKQQRWRSGSHPKSHSPSQPRFSQLESETRQPEEETLSIIRQPETRPIALDQLVAEVKGIYAGLVMVESKCIEVDKAQSAKIDDGTTLADDQWQALIALHRTLLHEHYDFFLASQHPSASTALRRLASKYAMPARMWRHGIHSFLELLRHKLPASHQAMLTFIYLAYSMVALLYETVPAFEDTWIECLGDLSRYRMAIEDDDIRDREVWTGVSRYWYSKASDRAPTIGRLCHHLAILARPNALQQLYYYVKSLCVPSPFLSARESIMTLFDPLLLMKTNTIKLARVDAAFVRVHAILFSHKSPESFDVFRTEFLKLLDDHISGATKRWLESGYLIGITLCCSLLEYGDRTNVLRKAMPSYVEVDGSPPGGDTQTMPARAASDEFKEALSLTVQTYEIVVHRWGDTNTLSFVHTILVFVHRLTCWPSAMPYIEEEFPWKLTAIMLNYLIRRCKFELHIEGDDFPASGNDKPRPVPEDYAMRGLIYTEDYYTDEFFNTTTDEDEKFFELPSMIDERRQRILWLGRRIADHGKWLTWNMATCQFSVTPQYDINLDGVSVTLPDDATT